MFKQILLAIVFVASAATVNAERFIVKRDMTEENPNKRTVEEFGCIMVMKNSNGTPYPSVTQDIGEKCADFERIFEGDQFDFDNPPQVRYLEKSTGKLMSHSNGGHWLYFDGPADDKSTNTLFYTEKDVFWNTQIADNVIRPANSDNIVYAQYDSGDLNVKGSGFKVYI